jgi:hypothetical protein
MRALLRVRSKAAALASPAKGPRSAKFAKNETAKFTGT